MTRKEYISRRSSWLVELMNALYEMRVLYLGNNHWTGFSPLPGVTARQLHVED